MYGRFNGFCGSFKERRRCLGEKEREYFGRERDESFRERMVTGLKKSDRVL